MDDYSVFRDMAQAGGNADRITQILQSAMQQPQADPQQEFANATMDYQNQYGVSQGQRPDLAMLKQAEAQGHPEARTLDKLATNQLGNDEAAKDSFKQFVIDHPEQIDPATVEYLYELISGIILSCIL